MCGRRVPTGRTRTPISHGSSRSLRSPRRLFWTIDLGCESPEPESTIRTRQAASEYGRPVPRRRRRRASTRRGQLRRRSRARSRSRTLQLVEKCQRHRSLALRDRDDHSLNNRIAQVGDREAGLGVDTIVVLHQSRAASSRGECSPGCSSEAATPLDAGEQLVELTIRHAETKCAVEAPEVVELLWCHRASRDPVSNSRRGLVAPGCAQAADEERRWLVRTRRT